MDRMKEKRKGKARIGVFSVGYDVYWAQFPGLLEELLAKEEMFIRKFPQNEVDIIRFGMIDSPAVAYKKVKEIISFAICSLTQLPVRLVSLRPLYDALLFWSPCNR